MTPPVFVAHGTPSRPPLTALSALTQWEMNLPLAVALLAAASLYLGGLVVLVRRGAPWAAGRVVAFGSGLAVLAIAALSWVGAYDGTLFWVHAVQHMLLSMVAPVLLALGAPVTLALRVLPPRFRRWLLRLLHSLPIRVLSSPLVSLPLFTGTLISLYFSGWYEATLRNEVLHELQHLHFLVTGCLLFWPIFGIDPIPGRLPYIARLFAIILTLPAHIIAGLSIMLSTELIAGDYYRSLGRNWGPSLFDDQYSAGAVIWGTGDIVGLFYVAVLCAQWARSDDREARRLDRHHDRLIAAGRAEGTALAAYNDHLRRLAAADGPQLPRASGEAVDLRKETHVPARHGDGGTERSMPAAGAVAAQRRAERREQQRDTTTQTPARATDMHDIDVLGIADVNESVEAQRRA